MSKLYLKKIFYPLDSLKKIFLLSSIFVFSWSLFSIFLKYNGLVFYKSFGADILLSNLIFSLLITFFLRSIFFSSIGFFVFMTLPFLSYFYLRKGILYADLKDIDELLYALGDLSSYLALTIIFVFIVLIIYSNIKNFNFKIFVTQIIFIILTYLSFIQPENFKRILYPKKMIIDEFNISASFRFIGPVNGLFYNYLDTLSFERALSDNEQITTYNDFRSFNYSKNKKLNNIHLILLESFIDPLDFKNIKIKNNIIPDQWIEYKQSNIINAISPVIGGGSAQAEFEVICGVPSLLEYGTEFNRIGLNETSCLPNFLKKLGYKNIASQPLYASFFNIGKAYKSFGFDENYLASELDMSEMDNGWLKDESFFNQHFQLIEPFIKNDKPIFNYLFAVGCHSTLGQNKNQKKLINYPGSQTLERFLNCNTETLNHLIKYINKIQKLDPDSLIIVLPDHQPPGVISSFEDAGYYCDQTDSNCSRKVRGMLLGFKEIENYKNKNLAYYEIPELIINEISNNFLCKTIKCLSVGDQINLNGTIVNRTNLKKESDQTLSETHKEKYISLIQESWLK